MSNKSTIRLTEGAYGFAWGPVQVQRIAEVEGTVVLRVVTSVGHRLEIYVSPGGRSLRVFRLDKGKPSRELK